MLEEKLSGPFWSTLERQRKKKMLRDAGSGCLGDDLGNMGLHQEVFTECLGYVSGFVLLMT